MSATAPSTVKQPESAAHTLKKWFEQQVRMHPDEVDLRSLVEKAINDLGSDPGFRVAIIEEGIRTILPQIAHSHWTRERKGQRISPNLMPLDAAHQVSERLTKWYEHVGETIHKRLGAMNREELQFVAHAREARVKTEIKIITFERTLADRLPDDKITVEEHFQPVELAEIWNSSFGTS